MTTKAVYVVTSQGNDYYLEQFIISAYSLRLHNPNIPIFLVTDEDTQSLINHSRQEIHQYISELIAIKIPSHYNQMQKSRYIKTSLREYLEGDYLFIDTDTVITTSLKWIDDVKYDIGAVLDRHVPIQLHTGENGIRKKAALVDWNIPKDGKYFNSGIMYVRDNDFTHRLYKEWHNVWNKTLLEKGISIDQPALAKANANMGYPIVEMDGTYNCQIVENGLKYLNDAKIIHYYASNIGKWDCPYILRNDAVYETIKQFGITPEIEELVKSAKSAFNPKTIILAGNMCDAYCSTLNGIARRIYTKFPGFSQFLDKIYNKYFDN